MGLFDSKYYNLKKILDQHAQYNLIIGERSNGKTYAVLRHGITNYCEGAGQMAIVRRWQEDFRGKRGQTMFDALVSNDEVEILSGGKWTGVYYYSARWYLCKYDGETRITDPEPFAYAFSLASMEHDKSTSYPDVTTIVFDEFLSRGLYLPDEFVTFCNVVSTIVRQRDDVSIFMLGNTVNKYCPYFEEMGLRNVKTMKPGTIDVYRYGNSELKVAVEFCGTGAKSKASDVYFAFDNPKLQMITSGVWEVDLYPHLPVKYVPRDVIFIFYMQFMDTTLQGNVIDKDGMRFIFMHEKTTPIRDEDVSIVYSTKYDPRPNWRRNLIKSRDNVDRKIAWFFQSDSVYYSTNDVGEIVRNYFNWCKTN